MSLDVVVVGAGSVGLRFVRSLAESGPRITLVGRQDEKLLAAPEEDGRDIAITHHSRKLLHELGLWTGFCEEEIGTLHDAMALNGNSRPGLMFRHDEAGKQQSGWLLLQHASRRAAYAEVTGIRLITGVGVTMVRNDSNCAHYAYPGVRCRHTPGIFSAHGHGGAYPRRRRTRSTRRPGYARAARRGPNWATTVVADFESAYAGQILRHRQAVAEHQRDLSPLPPFGDPDGDPF